MGAARHRHHDSLRAALVPSTGPGRSSSPETLPLCPCPRLPHRGLPGPLSLRAHHCLSPRLKSGVRLPPPESAGSWAWLKVRACGGAGQRPFGQFSAPRLLAGPSPSKQHLRPAGAHRHPRPGSSTWQDRHTDHCGSLSRSPSLSHSCTSLRPSLSFWWLLGRLRSDARVPTMYLTEVWAPGSEGAVGVSHEPGWAGPRSSLLPAFPGGPGGRGRGWVAL